MITFHLESDSLNYVQRLDRILLSSMRDIISILGGKMVVALGIGRGNNAFRLCNVLRLSLTFFLVAVLSLSVASANIPVALGQGKTVSLLGP